MNIEQIAQEVADELGWSLESSEKFIAHCLSKLAEQVGEPVAWVGRIEDGAMLLVEPPTDWKATPLFTESQLIAAQQRTAEACAKAVDAIDTAASSNPPVLCAKQIRNGEWRKYL